MIEVRKTVTPAPSAVVPILKSNKVSMVSSGSTGGGGSFFDRVKKLGPGKESKMAASKDKMLSTFKSSQLKTESL